MPAGPLTRCLMSTAPPAIPKTKQQGKGQQPPQLEFHGFSRSQVIRAVGHGGGPDIRSGGTATAAEIVDLRCCR